MTLLPATTLERVKRRLDLQEPAVAVGEMDTLLTAMIAGASQAIEEWLQLPLYRESRTDVYSIRQFQETLWLRSYFGAAMPAPSITSVKLRSYWTTAWADVTAEGADTYLVSSEYPGLLLYNGSLPVGEDTVQVVYVSGFAGPTGTGQDLNDIAEELADAFPAISDAADQQVTWEYNRRKTPGQASISIQGSSTVQQGEVKLLTAVQDRLRPYRKLVLA